MKELSIEEKAKRYDKALGRMKSWVRGEYPECFTEAQKAAEFIFPELKESEDEKSKKWILEYLYDGLRKSDEQFKDHFRTAIAWLEKQDVSIKIKKGKNYLCTKTHKYAGVEWVEGVKYYSPENYSLVNQGCTYYCPKYSKEEHIDCFIEVEYDGCLEKQGKKKPLDYTHTNVFTEKVAIWFNNNFIVHDEYGVISDSFGTKEEMFEDFKNYMKEE